MFSCSLMLNEYEWMNLDSIDWVMLIASMHCFHPDEMDVSYHMCYKGHCLSCLCGNVCTKQWRQWCTGESLTFLAKFWNMFCKNDAWHIGINKITSVTHNEISIKLAALIRLLRYCRKKRLDYNITYLLLKPVGHDTQNYVEKRREWAVTEK